MAGGTGDFARAIDVNEAVLADGAPPGYLYTGMVLAHAGRGNRAAAVDWYRRGRDAYLAEGRFLWAAVITMHAVIWVNLPYAADDPEERRALADQAERWFDRARLPGLSPRFAHLPRLVIEGEWEEAETLARATRALGYGAIYGAIPLRALATLAQARGDRDLALAMVHDGLPHGADTEPGDAIIPNALLLQRVATSLCIESGDLVGARRWLEAHDRWLAWSDSPLGRPEGFLGWAAYHRATGETERAQAMATQALREASDPRQPLALIAAHRTLGELATAHGCFDEGRGHLDTALALAAACVAPHERALTLLAIGKMHASTGDAARAVASLEEATPILARLRAIPALRRADALAARLPHAARERAAHPDGLTTREIEVLRFVAAGKSNREIADALFISERTVNRHITNIYAKIGAHSKADATAYAFRHHLA